MKKSFLPRQGVSCGVLAFFFLLALGLDSGTYARAGQEKSTKSPAPSSSRSYQQKPRSTPPPPQKNYQPGQQSQPPLFPAASNPTSGGTKTGFFSGLAAGVTGGLLGGMLFHRMGLTIPGWGAEFGLVDICLILFILGIIFYEGKRLRAWRITKSAATRAGRSPFSNTYPVHTAGGSRRASYTDRQRPARPPGIR